MNKKLLVQLALLSVASQAWALPTYTIADLGTLGGSLSAAVDINEAGQIVGRSYTASGATHAFLYSNGVMTDLSTGSSSSYGEGINDHGQIVGSSGSRAFLYADGVMTDIGTLGGSSSSAQRINNAGEVVGYSDTGRGYNRAFLYSNGVMTDIGTLGGTNSAAFDINGSGQIVGASTPVGGGARPRLCVQQWAA
jgi:probable HAF family extracellular repeat protein